MSLRVDVLTLFPEAIIQYATTSVLGRAQERDVWQLHVHDIRDATDDPRGTVDDTPFGGGAGMVLLGEPILRTIEATPDLARPLFVLTPSGRTFNHDVARELSELGGFSLLCGRYEGIDQRALDLGVDGELSLGDFVLAGGELAALCIMTNQVWTNPLATGFSSTPSTPNPRRYATLKSPRYCDPVTTRASRGGDTPSRLRAPWPDDPTSWNDVVA
jgi:tRNA (guanine37-N1)-methyltransferase